MSDIYEQREKRSEHGDLGVASSPKTVTYSDSLDDEEFVPHKLREFREKNKRRCLPRAPLAVSVCYLAILVIFFAVSFLAGVKYAQSWPEVGASKKAYSPVAGALVPELQMFNLIERTNNYINKPGPELDKAWVELLQYSNVRLTEEEVDAIAPDRKQYSIPLPDGGYFGMITVFHELHCVKHLYKFVYADYYLAEFTTEELDRRKLHLEHCLDLLRQSIMCKADVQPITMRWADSVPVPGANYTTPHNCYNWDAVNNWAKSRTIDRIFEPGYLKHPIFGDVYSWDGLESLVKVGFAHEKSG